MDALEETHGGGDLGRRRLNPGAAGWWRSAVVYEVYLRSFADSDGDGIGDIGGLRGRLPYLADLGVDAVWITPWYPSPMADGGYDVSDYCDIDPRFGTLADADALLADAHALGLRVIVDLVANHTSERAPVVHARRSPRGPGRPERDRYFFRDGRAGGEEPPNDWISAFGGGAWTRVREPDGRPGQWYLHTFAPEQPDLDWAQDAVREEFDAVLRFWLDRGRRRRAGRRGAGHGQGPRTARRRARAGRAVRVAHLGRQPALGRRRPCTTSSGGGGPSGTPTTATGCSSPRPSSADPERLSRYVRPGRDAHQLQLRLPDRARGRRAPAARGHRREPRRAGARRRPGHLGAVQPRRDAARDPLRAGVHRARASAEPLVPASTRRPGRSASAGPGRPRCSPWRCPGSAYLYQGEELGLPEVEDLPEEALQDPTWERSGRTDRGRDGCRVPLPWSGDRPPFGFTAGRRRALAAAATGLGGAAPWPRSAADPASTLSLYRAALHLRRELRRAAHAPRSTWVPADDDVLAFDRGPTFRCVVNLSARPVDLAGQGSVLLASGPCAGELPPDTAVWLSRPGEG